MASAKIPRDAVSSLKSKKVGIYGGTFDPPHFGHLNLAIQLKETHLLDEVWVIPAWVSPHKLDKTPRSSGRHRLQMARLGFDSIPGFRVLDLEILQESVSYTIDTLHTLKKLHPQFQFYLLLGDDTLDRFAGWKDPEEICRICPLLIGSRDPEKSFVKSRDQHPAIRQAFDRGITKTRIFEISATEIRDRLQKKAFCGHLVPKEVLDYIYINELYLNTNN